MDCPVFRSRFHSVASFLAVVLFAFTPIAARGFGASAGSSERVEEFELVESIPVETNLDNPDIRNTEEVWLEMINGAVNTLEFEEFYVSDAPGEPLEHVLNAIVDAGQRDVRVRFIVDARMYRTYPERLDWLSKQENIEVRTIDMARISGGVMHAKYFIVDGNQVFLGSQNFDWRALKHIHEIGCRVRGKGLTKIFSDLFELDWKLADPSAKRTRVFETAGRRYSVPFGGVVKLPCPHGTKPPGYRCKDSIEVWPGYSPRGFIPDTRLWDEPRIVALIDSARREVDVQLLTYSSVSGREYYPTLDNALRSAAARGVVVKLIVSDWAKGHPEIDCLKSLSLFPNIEVKLSTIPQWSGGFVPYARVEHCKYMVVDGTVAWIGTSNWEKGYFHNSRNVGLVVRGKAVAEMLQEVFHKGWDGAYTYPVRPEEQYVSPKRTE